MVPVHFSSFPPHWNTEENNHKNERKGRPYSMIIWKRRFHITRQLENNSLLEEFNGNHWMDI